MNRPYVKIHDSNGELLNPIEDRYRPGFPTREMRRQKREKPHNNRKTKHSLSIVGIHKYKKRIQIVPPYFDENEKLIVGKEILHYDLQNQ